MADPGYRLVIECSNPSAAEPVGGPARPGVALGLVEGAAVQGLGVEHLHPGERHDDDLIPAIARLMSRAGLHPRDLAAVAVSIGPGGYTGLRMAVAAAKMICLATSAACIGVPTALVAARRVESPPERFAIALASKGQAAYLTIFGEGSAEPGTMATAADLAKMRLGALIADPFLPASIREEAARLGIPVLPLRLEPVACLEASLSVPPIDPLALAPLYGREAEAVTQWRRRRSGK